MLLETDMTRRAALLLALMAGMALAQQKEPRKLPKWEAMDYGPFYSSSVTMPWSKDFQSPDGITLKGITVKLGGEAPASLCFDTNLCRVAAGWTGGFLKLMGTPFEGTHRPPEQSRPALDGVMKFKTLPGPGWAHQGDFKDPRPEPYVPLPADWARYRGLYVNGSRVVFSYTVGRCPVLELPGFHLQEGVWTFSRTFRLGPSPEPMTLLVCEGAGGGGTGPISGDSFSALEGPADPEHIALVDEIAVGLGAGAPEGARWEIADGKRIHLRLPALPSSTLLRVVLGSGKKNDLPQVARTLREASEDPEPLTHGGPARFEKPVETRGVLGKEAGAYVVDTLTLPDNNPWHSWMRIGGFDFFADGRAAVCTWNGDVWIVSGIDASLEKLSWRRYATGLFQPLGLKIVEDRIYVLGRDQITRLHDLNGDGEADFYECFNNQCGVTPNFHEFALDLQADPEGNFYFAKGAPLLGTQEWDPISSHSGCMLKVSKDGSKLEVIATGLRAPNGSGMGPHGELTCSDNEGIWTPACRLNWIRKGDFLGAVGMHHTAVTPKDYDKPVFWIPHGIDNSSGGQAWVTSDSWGPLKGHLLHLSYGTCALFLVLLDKVGENVQGGAVRLPLTFATGIMRARFHPLDGQLYVAGLKGWQTSAARDGALQRVRYTGKPARTLQGLHVGAKGVDLTFTDPLDPEAAVNLENYSVQIWNYAWTKNYGSPEFSVAEPTRKGHDSLPVVSAKLSADQRTVSLEVLGIRPVMQMMVRVKVKGADGAPISLDLYNTINELPM
jgi:hypothetical protein